MLPTAQEQLDFLQNMQLILEAGNFTSTYKFALLLSLVNLSITQGKDTSDILILNYTNIAEQFIIQYWKQSLPFERIDQTDFVLQQNTGSQIVVIKYIQNLMLRYETLSKAMKSDEWTPAVASIAKTIKSYPAQLLQNIEGQSLNFLYDWHSNSPVLELKTNVMYCLRRFHGIIRQLVQQHWSDFVRLLPKNKIILNGQPDIQSFLFNEQRIPLKKLSELYQDIQNNKCFYCGKLINGSPEVDHFIPWSYYQQDTVHNFVVADKTCNGAKSNFLADIPFLEKWLDRNSTYDQHIQKFSENIGIINNLKSSHNIAQWAYQRALDIRSPIWIPPKAFITLTPQNLTHLFL